ncbi:MAG: phosphotransferase [Actinobacteria bacterium]|nr:phosphotransferase [Actinomycetota bacterium]
MTHDTGREASLWTNGLLARMPREIDHAVLAAGREETGTWLLMRDVSDELLPPDRRLTREESRRLLETFAAMHRRFAGERIGGACSLEDRIMIAAPATVAGEAEGVDYLPKMLTVGWEVFAEAVPEDVSTAVFGAMEDPKPLARELARCTATLIHNDLRGANLGLLSDRTIVIDWGMAGTGPCELDFAWYLFVNGWRIDATREQLVDDFRDVAADLCDPRALELAWLGQLCWHAPCSRTSSSRRATRNGSGRGRSSRGGWSGCAGRWSCCELEGCGLAHRQRPGPKEEGRVARPSFDL